MDDWIQALNNASKKDSYQSNDLLSGHHSWYDCSHARPTFCNVCREAFIGVRSRCLSCEVCKFKVHKRCMSRAPRNCKWTTLASIGSKKIIEDQDRNYYMPHQWLEGNLPVTVKCSYCDKVCGSVRRMQDFRCLWCKAYVHKDCKNSFTKFCDLGVCRVSILPPTYVNSVSSDGFIRASRAPNTSPLVVFVNSKSGDNQGVKFLRKFKQLLNPFQVFDLIQGGPVLGLRLFQNLDSFRVLVCGGDGSVGWVLREIDNLDLHKKCQIGVLPLGTGNDLARVLGWGAVLDDDNQLPKLLESFERATTKMLDRWSILTYENPLMMSANNHHQNLSNPHGYTPSNGRLSKRENSRTNLSSSKNNLSKSNSNIPANLKLALDFPARVENTNQTYYEEMPALKSAIWQSLADLLQNKNINKMIDSTHLLNEKVEELTMRVAEMYKNEKLASYNLSLGAIQISKNKSNLNLTKYQEERSEKNRKNIDAMAEVASQRCSAAKEKLNNFFELLKDELKSSSAPARNHVCNGAQPNAGPPSASASSESDNTDDSYFDMNPNKNPEDEDEDEDIDDDVESDDDLDDSRRGGLNDSALLNVINDKKFYGSSLGLSTAPKRPSSACEVRPVNGLLTPSAKIASQSTTISVSPNRARLTDNNDTELFIGAGASSNHRRQMLSSISKMFKDRRKILTRANSLKKAINQVFKIAAKNKSNKPNLASSSINLSIHSPSNSLNLRSIDNISNTDNTSNNNQAFTFNDDDFKGAREYPNAPMIVCNVDGADDADEDENDESHFKVVNCDYSNYDVYDSQFRDDFYTAESGRSDYYLREERPNTLSLDKTITNSMSPTPLNCVQQNNNAMNDFISHEFNKSNENDTVDHLSLCYTNEENDYQSCSKELSLQCFSLKDEGRFYETHDDIVNEHDLIDCKPIPSNQEDLISIKSQIHVQMTKGPQLEKQINELITQKICNSDRPLPSSMTCCSINESQSLVKSPSSLTINKSLFNGAYNCNGAPLASEEQSCMSTPITAKISPSNEEPFFRQTPGTCSRNGTINTTTTSSTNTTNSNAVSNGTLVGTSLSRPNVLNMSNSNLISIKIVKSSPNLHDNGDDPNEIPPQICITQNESDIELDGKSLDGHSPSPSFLGYLPSASSTAITPINAFLDTSSNSEMNLTSSPKANGPTKVKPKPFLLPPPLISLPSSSPNLNSSSSSNNLSARTTDFNSLGVPASPSGYSSSGSGYSKTPLPSPRISKKFSKVDMKSSYWQLPHQRGGISALSSTVRHRSRSKSSDKSSSPTSPSSPKFSFKHFPTNTSYGFIEKALLFNANALCAPIAAPVIDEPDLDLFTEKAVMNNYFGIGLDAKLALEFHITREEHPEKCRSRIRNHMLYGFLGGKEFVQRTYKNLEQKVLLECDGIRIPLKNVQGIVVLNIPSYTGGVNFWGTHNSKDDNPFVVPSFDDKILEVVAVSGCMQMALSRVVNISSNRIAQCRCVKIQILGSEGVPVQVDGEAWIQPPGIIYLVHKNRAQMLTRNKMFEHTLKMWSEKQKADSNFIVSLSKEELDALQSVIDKAISMIKRIKTASLKNFSIEHDLNGYAIQASSNLEAITVNGKLSEKSLRQQITDFLNSVGTLQSETGLFINEKSQNARIEPEIMEKIQEALKEIRASLRKLNDCQGIFQFPIENDQEFKPNKSRFSIVKRYKNLRIKHRDDKDMLKTLHSVPLEEWGPEEVSLWLESLKLSEYRSAFIKHDIRGTELRNLRHRDLRDIGIVKVGHIKRILDASKSIPKRVTLEKQSV